MGYHSRWRGPQIYRMTCQASLVTSLANLTIALRHKMGPLRGRDLPVLGMGPSTELARILSDGLLLHEMVLRHSIGLGSTGPTLPPFDL